MAVGDFSGLMRQLALLQQQNREGPVRAATQLGQGIEGGAQAIGDQLRLLSQNQRQDQLIRQGQQFTTSERVAGQKFKTQRDATRDGTLAEPFDPVKNFGKPQIGSPGGLGEDAPIPQEDLGPPKRRTMRQTADEIKRGAPLGSPDTVTGEVALSPRPAARTARPFPPGRKAAADKIVRSSLRVDVDPEGSVLNPDRNPKVRIFQHISALAKAFRGSAIRDAVSQGMDAATASMKASPNMSKEQFVALVKQSFLDNETVLRDIAPELFRGLDDGGLIPVPGISVRRTSKMPSGIVLGAAGIPSEAIAFDTKRKRELTEQDLKSIAAELGGELVFRTGTGSAAADFFSGLPTQRAQGNSVRRLGPGSPAPTKPTQLFVKVPALTQVRRLHPELGEFAEQQALEIARAFGFK